LNFQAGSILYRRATRADDSALRSVLEQNPMQGRVRLSLQRAPSCFAADNLMGRSVPVLALDRSADDRTVGMYECSFPPLWLNGNAAHAGYLGGLRVNPAYRRRPSVLKNGFASIPVLLEDELKGIPTWFTSIASDNHAARRILEAGLRGMPHYRPAGELETLVISTRQARRGGKLRQATPDDIPQLAELHTGQAVGYQFSARLGEHWLRGLCGANGLRIGDFLVLEEHGKLLACIALWDQRAFKQTVVQGYRFPLNVLRGAHNLAAFMRGRPTLPRSGARLESIFLAFLACRPSVPDRTLLAVLREALWQVKQRGAGLGIIGLSVQNPRLSGLRAGLRGVVYRTCIEQVTLHGAQAFTLDRRPPQPEIAIL